MGRKSSGGRLARAPARKPRAPKPGKQATAPVHVQSSGGQSVMGVIGSTIADGVAWGAGIAIAHRVADAIMGPRTIRYETVATAAPESTAAATSYSDACGTHYKAFQDCINSSGSDISKCQFYMDMLSECRKGSGLAA